MTAASDVLPGAARPMPVPAPLPLPAPRPVTDPVTKPAAHADAAPTAEVRAATAVRTKAGELTYVRSIRAVAMIAIVTLHVAFPLIYLYNSEAYGDWWSGSFLYLFGKTGSVLFVMVSGLLLLDPGKEVTYSYFFRRRFAKVLFPFLIWAAVYIGYRMVMKSESMGPRDIVDALVTGPVYYHLWFIQMILGLYLATPILRVFIKGASQKDIAYFLSVWFVGLAILPIITRFTGIEFGVEVMVATGFVGFYVLGYALRNIVLDRRGIRLAIAAIVATVAFTQLATHAMTVANSGTFDNFWMRNESINIIAMSVATFLLMKSMDWDALFARVRGLRFVILSVSNNSLGIYFVHVIVLEALAAGWLGVRLDGQSFLPFVAIPLIAGITIAISTAITVALKKIPVLRHAVP